MRRLIDNGTTPPARLPHIGHYGHLRKSYLEGYRPDLYTALAASEKLYEHCAEIDAAARSRIDLIMPELAKSAGATEELKAADPMKWVQHRKSPRPWPCAQDQHHALRRLPRLRRAADVLCGGNDDGSYRKGSGR